VTISTQSRSPYALRSAAVRATLAPSVYRTEPWRLVLSDESLEIHADWDRQLHALDPGGRQLVISCGSALLNARAALAAADCPATVERFPDRVGQDLLARITLSAGPESDQALRQLDAAVDQPQETGPDHSTAGFVPPAPSALRDAAQAHDVELFVVVVPEHLVLARNLCRQSVLQQESDPACQAELRAWRTHQPGSDGPRQEQTMVILGTRHDTQPDWLRTGEALQHVVLQSRLAYGARPMTHVIENPRLREELRTGLDVDVHPQVLLQLGPPWSKPPARRRRLVDVLSVAH
jgi:hypothetical protein